MQNFSLLKELSKVKKPVMLKRGFANTISEWLNAAKYILQGNSQVILCERGIRTVTGKTIDIPGAIKVRKKTDIPVIIDPSHGSEDPDLIPYLSRMVQCSPLSGTMVEVHWKPEEAKCDGHQALKPETYNSIFCSRTLNRPIGWQLS